MPNKVLTISVLIHHIWENVVSQSDTLKRLKEYWRSWNQIMSHVLIHIGHNNAYFWARSASLPASSALCSSAPRPAPSPGRGWLTSSSAAPPPTSPGRCGAAGSYHRLSVVNGVRAVDITHKVCILLYICPSCDWLTTTDSKTWA